MRDKFAFSITAIVGGSMIAIIFLIAVSLTACLERADLPAETYVNTLDMEYIVPYPPNLHANFKMGSPSDEELRDRYEHQHYVTLTRGFFIQTTEVTQGQWQEIMGSNPSYFSTCGDDCPVENISWRDAVEFCNALSRVEGLSPAYTISASEVTWDQNADGYRLPTEAEWELAARTTSGTALPNGDLPAPDGIYIDQAKSMCFDNANLEEIAWYCQNSQARTHPVKQKAPNQWGLYDMLGNVEEYVWDWWAIYASDSLYDPGLVDPTGPESGEQRVARGCNFGSYTANCRSAARYKVPDGEAEQRREWHGFRTARFY